MTTRTTPSLTPEIFCATPLDYIIVGGGLSGLTLAARLSEDPNVSVGIIEAGPDRTDMSEVNIPGYFGRNISNPDVDWMMVSTPQECLNGRQFAHTTGKVLGGSSAVCSSCFVSGSKDEYDAFARLGNEGWDWSSLQPYFRKSERLLLPESGGSTTSRQETVHGTNGPVQKSYPLWHAKTNDSFFETYEGLGIKRNHDPYSGDNVGLYNINLSVDPENVTRSYSASAYYVPNRDRKNLHVLTEATATRIQTKSGTDAVIATGVEFQSKGKQYVVNAGREVILCGGSFLSCRLLELSGIGNSEILNKFGIKPVVDLPSVGENLQCLFLQNHLSLSAIRKVTPNTETYEMLQDPGILAEHLQLYETEKKGIFSSAHSAFSVMPLDAFATKEEIEGIKSKNIPTMGTTKGQLRQIKIQEEWLENHEKATAFTINLPAFLSFNPSLTGEPGCRYQTFFVVVCHPFSRGSCHIGSADSLATPVIDPKYLSNPVDLETMLAAVKHTRKVMVTSPLKDYHLDYEQVGASASDDELREWIRNNGISMFHPVGTASMLPREDGGVVDSNLVVYGTKNIRVVDASIIPLVVSVPLQDTLYAIAEKVMSFHQ
ncbi:GMC oxidoreductase [Abortiporus biennis]|nr:GMC oxidoreductase [Abortiporus biennis]